MTELIKEIDKIVSNKNPLAYEEILFSLYNSSNYYLESKLIKGSLLYRVRQNEDQEEYFKKTENLSYPPVDKVSFFNRVSRPGQTMFYSSELCPMTSIELLNTFIEKNEVNKKSLFTYSEWQLDRNLDLLVLAFPENEYTNGFKLKDQYSKYLSKQESDIRSQIINQYGLSSHYFYKISTLNNSVYIVTSAIANIANLLFPNIDGFLYPSVENHRIGYNIALKPNIIETGKLKIKKVWMEEWTKKSDKSVSINSERINGKINNNEIIWNIR